MIYHRLLICALLQLAICLAGSAQMSSLPQSVQSWLSSEGLEHATVTLQVTRLPRPNRVENPRVIYSLDPERMVIPASVMKLVTAATAFRTLGPDYIWPDSIAMIDTLAAVPLAGLERYNPDWLIEDIDTDYMPPLDNVLPDGGRKLSEVLDVTLSKSLNLQAETTLRLLTPSCRLDSSLCFVEEYWAERGLDVTGLRMYDGCGLSPSDRITASFVSALLCDMQFDAPFREALPVVGKEGTVRRFLLGSRLAGHAWLKTGTMKNVVAYAGYAKGSDACTYAVAIFVNNHTCPTSKVREGIAKVLLSLIP